MPDTYTPAAWRMDGYYPDQYAKSMAALGIGIDYDESDYDRYEAEFRADLAAHDAEVAAKALRDAADHLPPSTPGRDRVHEWLWARAFRLSSGGEG